MSCCNGPVIFRPRVDPTSRSLIIVKGHIAIQVKSRVKIKPACHGLATAEDDEVNRLYQGCDAGRSIYNLVRAFD